VPLCFLSINGLTSPIHTQNTTTTFTILEANPRGAVGVFAFYSFKRHTGKYEGIGSILYCWSVMFFPLGGGYFYYYY
jgi:hypothetical protein